MKAFYLIQDGKAQVGQGTIVPSDFIEYTVGEEPKELLEALEAEKVAMELQAKIQEAKAYLDSTDHKVGSDYELKPDEDLEAIKAKRSEARQFIRDNK